MKIKTDLPAAKLLQISKGIRVAAEKQAKKRPYIPANQAEESVLSDVDDIFSTWVDSLQQDTKDIFNG